MKVFVLILVAIWSLGAQAFFDDEIELNNKAWYQGEYLIGVYGEYFIDYSLPTHIIVAGSAKTKESDQFFQSAVTRAMKYKELNPTEQVVIISSPEVIKRENISVFEQYQVNVVEIIGSRLTGRRLIEEMSYFDTLLSFDFYGHSSPWSLILGKKESRLSSETYLKQLRYKFSPLAYATLNGCNGGLLLAPQLSALWHIPVSGALTGSVFEGLKRDGYWYGEWVHTHSTWARRNSVSFVSSKNCYLGGCWRMKPMATTYHGYWGKFSVGLPFYKFFCRFNDKQKCQKAMAYSLLSFPSVKSINLSSSVEYFQEVVIDYLCPSGKGHRVYQQCRRNIIQAAHSHSLYAETYFGKILSCSLTKCESRLHCQYNAHGPIPKSCILEDLSTTPATTVMKEYYNFVTGFELLQNR